MKRTLAVLAALACAACAEQARLHSSDHYGSLFSHWLSAHDMKLEAEEHSRRLAVFAANSDLIEEHNAAAREGKYSYTLGHNEFSHLSWEEFKAQKRGFNPRADSAKEHGDIVALSAARRTTAKVADLPDAIDWEAKGAVTSVKNQGQCGSCWAFSAVGALEGAVAIATGKLVDLSEEQVLVCDKVDSGCGGGNMETAFDWIKENGGICTAEDWPYTGLLPPFKRCRSDCTPVPGTQLSGWVQADADEKSVMQALAKGPLAVAIEADQLAFQFYRDGVFSAPCGTDLDHGVVLVGYGTDEDSGLPYWKVKNSWGSSWGKDGYIYLARPSADSPPHASDDAGGECGILMDATYPVLASAVPVPAYSAAGVAAAAALATVHHHAKVVHPPCGLEAAAAAGAPLPESEPKAERTAMSALQAAAAVTEEALLDLWRSPVGSAEANDCSTGGCTIVFSSIDIDPKEPARGKPVEMRASGVLTKPVRSGKYALSVKLSGVTLFEHSGDVCGESSIKLPLGLGKILMHGLNCPANVGEVHYGLDVHMPSIAPPGSYTIELTAEDQDSTDLMCLKADLKL